MSPQKRLERQSSGVEEQSCYSFEEQLVPKEERIPPLPAEPPSQPKRRDHCKSRSPESTATTQEEDSAATQEKPPAKMREDVPNIIPREKSHCDKYK